jgi:hypothetical protein
MVIQFKKLNELNQLVKSVSLGGQKGAILYHFFDTISDTMVIHDKTNTERNQGVNFLEVIQSLISKV